VQQLENIGPSGEKLGDGFSCDLELKKKLKDKLSTNAQHGFFKPNTSH
jgi:hypothetical protein